MKYQSPPYFLNPVAAAWQIVTWIECKGTSSGTVPYHLPVMVGSRDRV